MTAELPPDLQEFDKEIEKLHGPGITMRGCDSPLVNHIPTGIFILDFALLGGIAQGYVAMVYGYHSTGKTLNLLRVVAEYQKKNPEKWVGFLDCEGMWDKVWAEKNGVDTSRVLVQQPEYGELAVDLYESMMQRESIGMIIVDSIPHMVPAKVLENSAEDDTMAAGPRLMGKFCSKLTMGNNRERRKGHWITTLLVNQYRSKVGFVLGNPLTLPGGFQLNHIPTTKIKLTLSKTHMGKDRYENEVVSHTVAGFLLEKVKHGQSIRSGEYQVCLNADDAAGIPEGAVDNYPTVVAYAKRMGYVHGSGGSWKLLTENLASKRSRLLASGEMESNEVVTHTVFARLDMIIAYLKDDYEEYSTLARSLIATQRVIKGLPPLPPDGYLISHVGRLVLDPQP